MIRETRENKNACVQPFWQDLFCCQGLSKLEQQSLSSQAAKYWGNSMFLPENLISAHCPSNCSVLILPLCQWHPQLTQFTCQLKDDSKLVYCVSLPKEIVGYLLVIILLPWELRRLQGRLWVKAWEIRIKGVHKTFLPAIFNPLIPGGNKKVTYT